MNLRYIDEYEKNNELVRTKTNSGAIKTKIAASKPEKPANVTR